METGGGLECKSPLTMRAPVRQCDVEEDNGNSEGGESKMLLMLFIFRLEKSE